MHRTLLSLPRQDGFSMPAEWAKQAQTWMAWPVRPDNWRGNAVPAQRAFATVANTIAEHQPVSMAASGPALASARALLSPAVRLIDIPSDDAWMRDIGPTFVRHPRGEVRAVDWIFNAWGGLNGGLYQPWDADDRVAQQVAHALGIARYRAPLVLEGGAIHVDGEGTCLTTEACLRHPNRNPNLTQDDLEQALRDYLGVSVIVWLGRGLLHDETDGHIDNLCCFLRPGVVALAWSEDPQDIQHAIAQDALARLRRARDAQGRTLEIIKLPIPQRPVAMSATEAAEVLSAPGTQARPAGVRLAASYVNFTLCNGAIILPRFEDPNDDRARAILAEQFPDRVIRQVPGREILYGGGNVHCITQQQPAGV